MKLWKICVAILHLLASFAHGAGESERVLVASAKVRAAIAAQAELPNQPPNVIVTPRRMSLEITGNAETGAEVASKLAVNLHTTTNCGPCRSMKAAMLSDPRLVVTERLNEIPRGVPARHFPFITFRDDSGTLRYNLTVRTADEVVRLIERNRATKTQRRLTPAELKSIAATWTGPETGISGMTPRQHLMDSRHGFTADQLAGLTDTELLTIHSAHHAGDILPFAESTVTASEAQGSVGSAGVIRGGALIRSALDWWQANIGEGVRVSGSWSRNGGQMLPLASLGRWTAREIYGTHGEFQIDADGSKLPVKTAVMGYKLIGDRVRLTAQTELDAAILGIETDPQTVATSQPVGVSPMLVLSVLSTVWQLLHPQADLSLPGRVTCDAVMSNGVLLVTFNERPTIRLVMLFTFNLGVQSMAISRESVVVKFSGSRWIRERTFEVRE